MLANKIKFNFQIKYLCGFEVLGKFFVFIIIFVSEKESYFANFWQQSSSSKLQKQDFVLIFLF
jgi:hypothetical protein